MTFDSVVYENEAIKTILSLFYERFCTHKNTHKQKLTNKAKTSSQKHSQAGIN